MDTTTTTTWTPPVYNTSKPPALAHTTSLSPDDKFPHNFARTVKWCPDGSVALAQCENRSFQYLDLPPELVDLTLSQTTEAPLFTPPKSRTIPQAGPILDFVWYPRATPHDPASFCFVASVRESPVRLLDASDGRLRASYKIVDHRERQIAPHSLAFNNTAQKLYCGFEGAIEVFDLTCPGEGTRLLTTPSRKSRDGLKGLISALTFCPSYDPSYSLFAAGSLNRSSSTSSNIALFSEDTGEKPVGWIGDVQASVMQLAFNPMKPHILYGSFRRRDEIYSWDIRGNTMIPIQIFRRNSIQGRLDSNQKLRFDIDICGNWMAVGDHNGDISVFNLQDGASEAVPAEDEYESEKVPTLKFHAHDDAVGSVAFHPLRPLLLSGSGSRHFSLGDDDEDPSERRDVLHDSNPSSGEDSDASGDEGRKDIFVKRRLRRPEPHVQDSSVELWDFQ
ncbi:WD40 repeat-like protein [Dentipellis sp. KUC8613]|nr:WD40 repeat-like protein [Dentipellis sp. KUC8613]